MFDELAVVAAPELRQPVESQSNGFAETTFHSVKHVILCHNASFDSQVKRKLPMNHPSWGGSSNIWSCC